MRHRWVLTAALAWTACGGEFALPTAPGSDGEPVLLAAGDIAVCGSNGAMLTARLIENELGTVVAVGDLAYPSGTAEQFRECYEPTWGRHKSRTRPAPGNHEYESPGAAPYFAYFGSAAGPPGLGYYRYKKGAWQIYSLNSNVESAQRRSQLEWLSADLKEQTAPCVAAYFHHPLVSSGSHGLMPPVAIVGDIWRILHAAGVEVVIAAHEHFYERFSPMDADGRIDLRYGIRQFIAGTGGAPLREPLRRVMNSEVAFSKFGILRLTLEPASYRWEFVSAEEGSVLDSGTGLCHDKPTS